jgi:integrase
MAYRNLMNRYHPSTLEKRKGKWYVSVTKPRELQFGKDKQKRKSTGTSDKRQAEYLQHELTQAIHDEFDKELKKTDRFFEAVRPLLEAEGVRTRDWYDKGRVVVTLEDEKSFVFKLGGGKKPDRVKQITEEYVVDTHASLVTVLTLMGHSIPADLLTLLDDDTRAKVLNSAKPFEATPEMVMKLYEQSKGDQGFVTGLLEQFKKHAPTKINATEMAVQEASEPKLEDIIDAYIATRPEKSRKADMKQLKKWLNHPLGSIPLKDVTQYDSYDFLIEFGEILTKSSIKVLRSAMSNVYKWAGKKRELGITGNPFRGLDLRDIGKDGTPRRPFTQDELHKLFQLDMTDSQRDALTILITTGMRSGELRQMTEAKVHVRDGIRYMDLTTSDTQTKNTGSKRLVPLHDKVKDVAFPIKFSAINLNTLVRKLTDDPTLTLHSTRHSYKDLNRDAGVSKEIQDFITGHAQGDVASSYGQGPSIKTRYEAIMAVPHPWFQ